MPGVLIISFQLTLFGGLPFWCLPLVTGASYHDKATSGSLVVQGCGFRYLGAQCFAASHFPFSSFRRQTVNFNWFADFSFSILALVYKSINTSPRLVHQ